MTDVSQEHSGEGHNIGGDKITIEGNYVVYLNTGRKVNRWLTTPPRLREKLVGREDDLKRLAQKLEQEGSVVLMKAMGGIGKTTLAIEYTNRYKKDYAHVAFIEHGEHFGMDILNKTLIKNLGLEGDITTNTDENVELVFNALTNLGGKRLLVIDNANDSIIPYRKHLPTDWHILITSRQQLEFHKDQIFELDFLSPNDAKTLFYNYYEREIDDVIVKAILHKIDYHTLAIELLAKTAHKRRNISLKQLFQILQKQGIDIGRRANVSSFRNEGQKVENIFGFLSTIFKVQNISEDEELVLHQFLLWPPIFHPVSRMEELLELSQEKDMDQYDQFTDTIESLKEKGWLIFNPREDAYKLHAILHDVLKIQLEIKEDLVRSMISMIAGKLFLDQTKDHPVHKFFWIPFGFQVLQMVPNGVNWNQSTLENNLGDLLRRFGQFKSAQGLLQKALRNAIHNFGENHSTVATTQSNLALVLQDLGQFRPAQKLLQKALINDLHNFGENHPNVAIRQSNLAVVLQDLGQFKPAQELLEKALKNAIHNFGENHPNVAINQSNLALVLKDLRQLKPAQELLEKALKNELHNFGENHPTVATTQSNLALVLQILGQLEPAQELLQKALKNDLLNFGENHPNVAIRQSNLALIFQDLGQLKPAQELLQKALKNDLHNFGQNHPTVATTQSNLALVLKDLGQLKLAQELLQEALKNDLLNFGENHPNVATTQSNLASVYREMDDLQMAKRLSKKAATIWGATLGEEHPRTISEKEWLTSLEEK